MSIETKITNEGKWEIYDGYKLLVEPSEEWIQSRQSNGHTTPEPTTEEILWQTITDLQLDLIATNQALTDAQLEIELLKGGV